MCDDRRNEPSAIGSGSYLSMMSHNSFWSTDLDALEEQKPVLHDGSSSKGSGHLEGAFDLEEFGAVVPTASSSSTKRSSQILDHLSIRGPGLSDEAEADGCNTPELSESCTSTNMHEPVPDFRGSVVILDDSSNCQHPKSITRCKKWAARLRKILRKDKQPSLPSVPSSFAASAAQSMNSSASTSTVFQRLLPSSLRGTSCSRTQKNPVHSDPSSMIHSLDSLKPSSRSSSRVADSRTACSSSTDLMAKSMLMDKMVEEMLQLDSAYDATESEMLESGWNSLDEVRMVHHKRLHAWAHWREQFKLFA
ncbi:hypothetical protein SJAG_01631 [Schizosaccharomyces japonicus yFS275]|uniref:Uncharacterized protein n=1 Tax=Schizosaccharomyces japonicus (strain yFS275 / FY16936) TaxID=402676 RepID=B6JYG9_SCHJY|nr:hypothetical protein SJAG_01631 [Schizosaccharomyces japonicus yFS275]EEB06587.2 hypothetical protein SJAG_01631 [Schizosaccharomyces japonicus yFS275]